MASVKVTKGDMQVTQYNHINWAQVEGAVDYCIYTMGYNHYKPSLIVGVARGGLIPAIMLAHKLDVPWVEGITLQFQNPDFQQVITPPGADIFYNRQQVLFVDDLWDSGTTMTYIRERWPEALTATMFFKRHFYKTQPPLNFPGVQIDRDKWAVFPWEVPPDQKVPSATRAGSQQELPHG